MVLHGVSRGEGVGIVLAKSWRQSGGVWTLLLNLRVVKVEVGVRFFIWLLVLLVLVVEEFTAICRLL